MRLFVALLAGLLSFEESVVAQVTVSGPTLAPASQVSADGSTVVPVVPASMVSPTSSSGFSSARLKELMRPTFRFGGQWYAQADGVDLSTYETRVTFPTYPIFGPPPPLISAGFAYTDLNGPAALDLPGDLYESSLGLTWMRRWNDRWMFRSMLGIANATDGNNNSSDSWQFRGGIFAMYQPNPCWTWTIGAIALGRNDIPVVPAIGLIYQPNPRARYDFTFPRPRASFLMADSGQRQQWVYAGASLDGGTWAYQTAAGIDDQVTYRDWQFVLGWESTPRLEMGMQFARGRRFGLELGYAFAREFEFERGRPDIEIGETVMLRATISL